MIEKITNQNQIARHKLADKINELIDVVNGILAAQEQYATIYKEDIVPMLTPKNEEPAENTQDETLKCPFCQQELLLSSYRDDDTAHQMWNCLSCQLSAQRKIWQELIRTRKTLEIAVDAIKNATEYLGNQEPLVDVMATNLHTDLSKALEQITALEQKE